MSKPLVAGDYLIHSNDHILQYNGVTSSVPVISVVYYGKSYTNTTQLALFEDSSLAPLVSQRLDRRGDLERDREGDLE